MKPFICKYLNWIQCRFTQVWIYTEIRSWFLGFSNIFFHTYRLCNTHTHTHTVFSLLFLVAWIFLTFAGSIDPTFSPAFSVQTNTYNCYWVPMTLSACLGMLYCWYKSIHTHRNNMWPLLLTRVWKACRGRGFNKGWLEHTDLCWRKW